MKRKFSGRLQVMLNRLWAGRKRGCVVFGSVFVGAPAVAIGLLGVSGVIPFLLLVLAAVLSGLLGAYIDGKGAILPVNLVDDVRNDEAPYRCEFSNEARLTEACELTRAHYAHEYVSGDQANRWRRKNSKAFVHLLNREQELVASFGVLALTKAFTEMFFKGNVTDLQLDESEILSFEESLKSPTLYISGVIVREPNSGIGKKRAVAMLWVMFQYLRRLYGTRRQRILYAIAVNKASEQLLTNLGFSLECEKTEREDNSRLYCLKLDNNGWKALREKVRAFGDSSSVCDCAFLTSETAR